jgi:acyl-CoA hydrolase
MSTDISTMVRPIKYEDLNHHHTLFAGKGAAWMVEAGFIAAARCVGKPEDVVCVQLHGMRFTRPVRLGDIVEIRSQVARLGASSITTYAALYVNDQPEPAVTGYATFVTVDAQGKAYPHGVSLPADYAARYPAVVAGAEGLARAR